jgi:hypothetical protein
MAAAYDQVSMQMPGGGHNLLTPAEFERIPLSERVHLLLTGKLVFLKDGQVISPRDALSANPGTTGGSDRPNDGVRQH